MHENHGGASKLHGKDQLASTHGHKFASAVRCCRPFGGGAGPGWIGLAGSDVELAGGTVVVADTDYLIRAIADPSAELVADYTLKMPANNLSDAEIADIVAYIETRADG